MSQQNSNLSQQNNILKDFNIKVYWSDESTGNCESDFNIKANNIDEVWNYIFKEQYLDNRLESIGTYLDYNIFSFDLYYSEKTNQLEFYDDLAESDLHYNEDDELDIYCKTYTIEVYEDDYNYEDD